MNTKLTTINDTAQIKYADLLDKVSFGQSNYSNENFLVGQEHTPHRQLRQILMQYDQLCYTLLSSQTKQEQNELDIDEKTNAIERERSKMDGSRMDRFDIRDSEIKIRRLELEIHEIELGKSQTAKMITDALATKANYEKILSTLIPQVEKLEAAGVDYETAENVYWKQRLGEDAKLDMFNHRTGNQIGKETLRAIMRMDEEARGEIFEDLGLPANASEQLGLLAAKPIVDLMLNNTPSDTKEN